jgi:hypothetical protein
MNRLIQACCQVLASILAFNAKKGGLLATPMTKTCAKKANGLLTISWWEPLLCYIIINDLFPFMVGQSHDSFTLLSIKDVMLLQHCQQAMQCCAWGTDKKHSEANLSVK